MWRPGKLRFLIGVKNRFLSADRDRQKTRPLAGPRRSPDSQLRSGYALPSSRIRRHFLILIDVLFSSCLPLSTLRCEQGHTTVVTLPIPAFELLFDFGCSALLDG